MFCFLIHCFYQICDISSEKKHCMMEKFSLLLGQQLLEKALLTQNKAE